MIKWMIENNGEDFRALCKHSDVRGMSPLSLAVCLDYPDIFDVLAEHSVYMHKDLVINAITSDTPKYVILQCIAFV